MTVKLLTDKIWSFYALQEAAQARLSLHLSKCHIVGNHMPRLISFTECGPPPSVPTAVPKLKHVPLEIGSRFELVCMAGFVSKSPKPMIAECLSSLEWAMPMITCVRRGKYYSLFLTYSLVMCLNLWVFFKLEIL